jgi:hypothetical protein
MTTKPQPSTLEDVGTPDAYGYEEVIVDDQLAAALARRGVRTAMRRGDRVRLQVIHGESNDDSSKVDDDPFAGFIGSIEAPRDFAARADEILRDSFGRS